MAPLPLNDENSRETPECPWRLLGKLATCLWFVCWFGVAHAGRAISYEILFGA